MTSKKKTMSSFDIFGMFKTGRRRIYILLSGGATLPIYNRLDDVDFPSTNSCASRTGRNTFG
jgi:hypothetical protein